MKSFFPLAYLLLSAANVAIAGVDCKFSDKPYTEFRNQYLKDHQYAKLNDDNTSFTVTRNDEVIQVFGNGCFTLGGNIIMKLDPSLSDEQFIQKTVALYNEFGSWLPGLDDLDRRVKNGELKKGEIFNSESRSYELFINDKIHFYVMLNHPNHPGELRMYYYIY